MKLFFHNYKYYPYERHLALREACALLGAENVTHATDGLELSRCAHARTAERLVYFSQIHNGRVAIDTVQARLERAVTTGKRRQATRYSVHGLHEYKGKFNPQICKAILNIFGVRPGDHVLDPFCGSGTTLVECSHIGAQASGIDRNPLAVFIANAKLQALVTPSEALKQQLRKIETALARRTKQRFKTDQRTEYLKSWFNADVLSIIEGLRTEIFASGEASAPFFLCVASNLLRDYSLQDPNDLRIRRRASPLPDEPLATVFLETCQTAIARLAEAQAILGMELPRGDVHLGDSTTGTNVKSLRLFDAALTSPPYAMALPYIDTQRLSLVWLDLVDASEILALEAKLVGSREMRGATRRELHQKLADNASGLPQAEYRFCRVLQSALSLEDGFRRQAVPLLLYRYFEGMRDGFRETRKKLRTGAPYALIIGHNHTILGGMRHNIDTPRHLASLATSEGWELEEIIELQTYQRYGYHMNNAVSSESLVLLRNR